MKILAYVMVCMAGISCGSCEQNTVVIHSTILRDRVVVADHVVLKKALYVAFSLPRAAQSIGRIQVTGHFLHEGQDISQARTTLLQEKNGNLVFDLPYEIPDGPYSVQIEAVGDQGSFVEHGHRTVQKSDLKKYNESPDAVLISPSQEVAYPPETSEVRPTKTDRSAGYIIFSRGPLEYVFPNSKPRRTEEIPAVSLRAVRNGHVAASIALYPLRRLGNVKVTISDLRGTSGRILKENISINHIETVEDTIGLPPGQFRKLPTLIRPGGHGVAENDDLCRFLLRIKIDPLVQPGAYSGVITITAEYGKTRTLPCKVIVEPISLEDIPNKDYFMLMTYEFTELALPGNTQKKDALYRAAVNILKDYKEHGMTTIAIHSPFVLLTHEDGSPVLDDIFAALIAARDQGFTRPIIWYMGHLIQTAKPKHPGNITAFYEQNHLERLAYLVKTVTDFAEKNQCPPVIFLPIDEPGDSHQDYQKRRETAVPLLFKAIKDLGGKTMLTTEDYNRFKPIDYVCSGEVRKQDVQRAHQDGSVYWAYNNDVTTKCDNPAYARYIYGYYTWKQGVDGMASWTFQNTQNASGWPTKADSTGQNLYLAYPDPSGPLATLKWEAMREGIDDHKIIYQLVKRIALHRKKGMDASRYEAYLSVLRERPGGPGCRVEDQSGWDPTFFDKTRDELISLIIDADRRLALKAGSTH